VEVKKKKYISNSQGTKTTIIDEKYHYKY